MRASTPRMAATAGAPVRTRPPSLKVTTRSVSDKRLEDYFRRAYGPDPGENRREGCVSRSPPSGEYETRTRTTTLPTARNRSARRAERARISEAECGAV